jgi:tetratricopeptide (TPR) repeat protein
VLGVVDDILPGYRSRAILGLAHSYYMEGSLDDDASIALEAARVAREDNDYVLRCMALRHLAVIRSMRGDHCGSLRDLNRLLPAMRCIVGPYSAEYYTHLNSIAVELGELGRIEEANAAVDVALRSPFASNYPDWHETKADLSTKRARVFTPLIFPVGDKLWPGKEIHLTSDFLKVTASPAAETEHSHRSVAIAPPRLAEAQTATTRIHRSNHVIGIVNACSRISSQCALDAAGHQLASLARTAWMSRQLEDVERISQAIIDLPVHPKFQNVGYLYKAHLLKTAGDIEAYEKAVLRIADQIPPGYRARAVLAVADSCYMAGNIDESALPAVEAARIAKEEGDYLTRCVALRHLAIVRSFQGDHIGALKDLDRLHRVVLRIREFYPSEYCDYLNSLSVELGEAGRIEEATRAVDIALHSPFAKYWRSWQDTKLELAAKPRKVFTPLVFALGASHQAQGEIQPALEKSQPVSPPALRTRSSEPRVPPSQVQPMTERAVRGSTGALTELLGVIDVCGRVSSQHALDLTAHKFAALARRAWLSRNLDALEEISREIIRLPVDTKTQNIGRLYSAYRLQTEGDVARYQRAILDIVDNIIPAYQPRAILALGVSHYLAGEVGESAYLCIEAARAAQANRDYVARYSALRHVAVIRSAQGDHIGALKDLERLRPVAISISSLCPSEYYEHLNSLAVELGELGRIEEANRAVDLALRSPFAPGYPHWQETKLELAAKQPKVFTPLVFTLGAAHQAQEIQLPLTKSQTASQPALRLRRSKIPASASQVQPTNQPMVTGGTGAFRGLLGLVEVCARVSSQHAVDLAAHRLAAIARRARVSRDGEALEIISQAILSLQVSDPRIHNLGHFYRAFCLQARGDLEASRVLLLHVTDDLLPEYQPRSILELGVSHYLAGDVRESVALYVEASKAAKSTDDYLTRCQALRNLAVIRSLDGDHKGALDDLDRQGPLVHRIGRFYPADYYNHLNSIAVELGLLGRIEEANRALTPALNSPFVSYYSAWQETKLELARQPTVFAPLVFALGAVHQAQRVIGPTRETLQTAGLAAPQVGTSENAAAHPVKFRSARTRRAIRKILRIGGANSAERSALSSRMFFALSPNQLRRDVASRSRAPPSIDLCHNSQTMPSGIRPSPRDPFSSLGLSLPPIRSGALLLLCALTGSQEFADWLSPRGPPCKLASRRFPPASWLENIRAPLFVLSSSVPHPVKELKDSPERSLAALLPGFHRSPAHTRFWALHHSRRRRLESRAGLSCQEQPGFLERASRDLAPNPDRFLMPATSGTFRSAASLRDRTGDGNECVYTKGASPDAITRRR